MRTEIDAQIGFRFWFRGARKSGSRVTTRTQMWEPFLGTSEINLFSKNWFQAFVWRSYNNHILSEAFFGPSVLVGVAAEIRQKIGFSFLRGGTRNLGPAKRSFLDGGAWKIIGIYSRARMQFRCLFIYGAVASPTN